MSRPRRWRGYRWAWPAGRTAPAWRTRPARSRPRPRPPCPCGPWGISSAPPSPPPGRSPSWSESRSPGSRILPSPPLRAHSDGHVPTTTCIVGGPGLLQRAQDHPADRRLVRARVLVLVVAHPAVVGAAGAVNKAVVGHEEDGAGVGRPHARVRLGAEARLLQRGRVLERVLAREQHDHKVRGRFDPLEHVVQGDAGRAHADAAGRARRREDLDAKPRAFVGLDIGVPPAVVMPVPDPAALAVASAHGLLTHAPSAVATPAALSAPASAPALRYDSRGRGRAWPLPGRRTRRTLWPCSAGRRQRWRRTGRTPPSRWAPGATGARSTP